MDSIEYPSLLHSVHPSLPPLSWPLNEALMRDIAALVARRQRSTYYISGEENKEDDNDNGDGGGHNMIAAVPLRPPLLLHSILHDELCVTGSVCVVSRVYCAALCRQMPPSDYRSPIDRSVGRSEGNSQSISRRCFAARTHERVRRSSCVPPLKFQNILFQRTFAPCQKLSIMVKG